MYIEDAVGLTKLVLSKRTSQGDHGVCRVFSESDFFVMPDPSTFISGSTHIRIHASRTNNNNSNNSNKITYTHTKPGHYFPKVREVTMGECGFYSLETLFWIKLKITKVYVDKLRMGRGGPSSKEEEMELGTASK